MADGVLYSSAEALTNFVLDYGLFGAQRKLQWILLNVWVDVDGGMPPPASPLVSPLKPLPLPSPPGNLSWLLQSYTSPSPPNSLRPSCSGLESSEGSKSWTSPYTPRTKQKAGQDGGRANPDNLSSAVWPGEVAHSPWSCFLIGYMRDNDRFLL